MKAGRKPEYLEKTPDDVLQKMPYYTEAGKFKPQLRLKPALLHWWQARKADVQTTAPCIAPVLLLREIYEIMDNNCCFTDCINKNHFYIGMHWTSLNRSGSNLVWSHDDWYCWTVHLDTGLWPNHLVGLVVKVSASRAEDLGFESRLRRDFFGVESYQWLQNWHSSGYPARRLAL